MSTRKFKREPVDIDDVKMACIAALSATEKLTRKAYLYAHDNIPKNEETPVVDVSFFQNVYDCDNLFFEARVAFEAVKRIEHIIKSIHASKNPLDEV